jgi:hypothetical protein
MAFGPSARAESPYKPTQAARTRFQPHREGCLSRTRIRRTATLPLHDPHEPAHIPTAPAAGPAVRKAGFFRTGCGYDGRTPRRGLRGLGPAQSGGLGQLLRPLAGTHARHVLAGRVPAPRGLGADLLPPGDPSRWVVCKAPSPSPGPTPRASHPSRTRGCSLPLWGLGRLPAASGKHRCSLHGPSRTRPRVSRLSLLATLNAAGGFVAQPLVDPTASRRSDSFLEGGSAPADRAPASSALPPPAPGNDSASNPQRAAWLRAGFTTKTARIRAIQ